MAAQMSLATIPKNILLELLRKMSAKALCQLRQTCSYLDKLIEENKKKIAAFPNYEGRLFLAKSKRQVKADITIENRSGQEKRWTMEPKSLADFEKKTSGISFDSLIISLERVSNENIFKEIMTVLKIQGVCKTAQIYWPYSEHIPEILDLIEAKESIHVATERYETMVPFLELLKKTRNAEKVEVHLDYSEGLDGMMEKAKEFRAIQIERIREEEDFLKIFWDICNATDYGNLRQMRLPPQYNNCGMYIENLVPNPRIKTIWDQSSFHSKRRMNSPKFVYQVESGNNNRMVLVQEDEETGYVFYFADNTAEDVLKKLIKEVFQMKEETVDRTLKEEYLTATDARKAEILGKIVNSYKYDKGNEDYHSDSDSSDNDSDMYSSDSSSDDTS